MGKGQIEGNQEDIHKLKERADGTKPWIDEATFGKGMKHTGEETFKKMFLEIVCVCCFAVTMNLIMGVSAADETEIVTTGEATIEKGTLARARQQAIDQALRQAVEQALGIFIKSESRVQNFQMLEDNIYSRSQGYVTGYTIISEERVEGQYRVSTKATVSLDSIEKKLHAIGILKGQLGYPRLLVVICNPKGQIDEASRTTRTVIEQIFTSKHFDLLHRGTLEKIERNNKLMLGITSKPETAARVGMDSEAEVVITGVIDTEYFPGSDSRHDKVYTRLKLLIVDPSTARIFSSVEEKSNKYGTSRDDAVSRAASAVGEQAANYAVKGILSWWEEHKNAGISCLITLKGLKTYEEAIEFQEGIQSISKVIKVNQRSFGDGIVEWDVVYKGEKTELLKSVLKDLKKIPKFTGLHVVKSRGNNILLTL